MSDAICYAAEFPNTFNADMFSFMMKSSGYQTRTIGTVVECASTILEKDMAKVHELARFYECKKYFGRGV